MAPIADKLTPIREACDLEAEHPELTAWVYIDMMGYGASPELLYAVIERCKVIQDPTHTDWYTLKAQQIRTYD